MTGPGIFFHADAIEGEGKDLVGRRSAGQSFLRGFLAHVPGDAVHAVTEDRKAAAAFGETARALGETRPVKTHLLRGDDDFTTLGTVFFPGPGYLSAAWQRQYFGADRCSLVGITHTVSTRRVIEGLHHLMVTPVEPWDAIICTSRAVHSVVARQLEEEAAFLRHRFGATEVPLPQLPVIPLGIHAADFAPRDGARDRLRDRFGAGDALVVMTMGRLTSVEKANPAPLFIALEQVAQRIGQPVQLWMVGWSSREDEAALHREGAAALAPSVSLRIVDGRDAAVRRDIWAAADVFTLPVDNIQETFGLVPVEAMAAGLPVVMPDWDGFRDTVRHGQTGFLIPTRMTGGGHPVGETLARRFADGSDGYLQHLSLIQQQTQIDIPAYVAALVALADPGLRARMGRAGQAHVAAHLDWSAVIPQYLALAEDLAVRRAGARAKAPRDPMRIDPFTLYGRYPTEAPDGGWVLTRTRTLDLDGLAALDRFNGRALYQRTLLPAARVIALLDLVGAEGPMTIAAAAGRLRLRVDLAIGAALFLAKYDYLTVERSQTNSGRN